MYNYSGIFDAAKVATFHESEMVNSFNNYIIAASFPSKTAKSAFFCDFDKQIGELLLFLHSI